MKTAKEIIQEIESMSDNERSKLLHAITKKYGIQGFPVGENFDFWFDGADDIYDEL